MLLFFFFKQKTAYEMRISDWSSDVCSSDLTNLGGIGVPILRRKGDPGGVHSKDKDQGDKDDIGEATRLVQAGRRPEWTSDPAGTGAIVNPPVWRASTILYSSVADMRARVRDTHERLFYGRRGTQIGRAHV